MNNKFVKCWVKNIRYVYMEENNYLLNYKYSGAGLVIFFRYKIDEKNPKICLPAKEDPESLESLSVVLGVGGDTSSSLGSDALFIVQRSSEGTTVAPSVVFLRALSSSEDGSATIRAVPSKTVGSLSISRRRKQLWRM